MKTFIKGTGNISPQKTYDNAVFLDQITRHKGPFLQCLEPDYGEIMPRDRLPRRLGRSLKIGVTAAGLCLEDAQLEMPDAIITGTGLGMLADTEKFLTTMLDNEEKFLNPTAFIQSTHNTIGAHIAVMLNCNKYNFTFVHGNLSFESALLNSMLNLAENPSEKILTGGIDELTEQHYRIKQVNGKFKKEPADLLKLPESESAGVIPGEGAVFFLLGGEKHQLDYACLQGLESFYMPRNIEETRETITAFLHRNELTYEMIDLVILGLNGDYETNQLYHQIREKCFRKNRQAWYKHLCGEYPTSSAFGVWLAANILKRQTIPEVVMLQGEGKSGIPIRNVLLYNHSANVNHSLILLSCVV